MLFGGYRSVTVAALIGAARVSKRFIQQPNPHGQSTSSKGNCLRTGKVEAALSHVGFAGCASQEKRKALYLT